MVRRGGAALAAAASLMAAGCGAPGPPPLENPAARDLVPERLAGGRRVGPAGVYGRDDLHVYMDGGAALYLAYAFRELAVARYAVRGGEEPLLLEIYRTDRPEEAFGLYSDGSEGEHPSIGQGASYGAGLLRFWKGRIFVRILYETPDRERTRATVLAAGRAIASRIGEEGRRPAILAALPPEGLVPDRVTYFHAAESLRHLYYLCDGNPLGLGPETEAVFAEYRFPEGRPKLIVLRHADAARADAARRAFEAVYLADRPRPASLGPAAPRVEVLEDGLTMGILRTDAWLILCFEASGTRATALLEAVRGRCGPAAGGVP